MARQKVLFKGKKGKIKKQITPEEEAQIEALAAILFEGFLWQHEHKGEQQKASETNLNQGKVED